MHGATIKIMMTRLLVICHQCFGGTYCLHLQGHQRTICLQWEWLYYIGNEWVRRTVIASQEETSWGMGTEMYRDCGRLGKWNKAEEGNSKWGNARERSANLTNWRQQESRGKSRRCSEKRVWRPSTTLYQITGQCVITPRMLCKITNHANMKLHLNTHIMHLWYCPTDLD